MRSSSEWGARNTGKHHLPRGVKHQREELGYHAVVACERIAPVDAAAAHERHRGLGCQLRKLILTQNEKVGERGVSNVSVALRAARQSYSL